MSNDLDLYSGGGLAPYSPSQPLAPAPDLGDTELSNRDDYQQYTGGSQTVFGQALPAGVSLAQAMPIYKQLGDVFSLDFMKLGYTITQTQKCVSWFLNAVKSPPAQEQRRHNYNLYEHTNDPIFQSWANYASDQGFSQKLVSDCCWWVTEATKRLNSQHLGTVRGQVTAQGRAPSNVEDQLTDQQYAVLVKHNENVKAQTMGRLEQRWGSCFKVNIELAQQHLNKMTPVEIQHFDRYTGSWPWTHFLNSYDGLVGLFEMAIGVNSMPTNGPAIAQEILQIEALMREPATRRAYLKDDALQARYRQLLSLTLGGR
ncbi:hypothetical protein [Pseudomonas sp. LB3P14]